MNRYPVLQLAAVFLLLAVSACDEQADGALRQATADTPPAYVDSIFPIDEEIRRFRAGLGAPVRTLSGGADSPEALVERFLGALQRSDRDALTELTVTAEEFAYLYYPGSRFSRRPYELSPALLWFQMENASEVGLRRAIDRLGGLELRLEHLRCDPRPEAAGESLLWSGCTVQLRRGGEDGVDASRPQEEVLELSLFAGILERDGRFKIFGYGNRL